MPRLLLTLSADHDEQTFDLPEGVTTIGREPGNGISIIDGSLSRRHARIMVGGGRTLLFDLGSKNGTRVNGEHIDQRTIVDGDEVRLGELVFVYQEDEFGAVPTPVFEQTTQPGGAPSPLNTLLGTLDLPHASRTLHQAPAPGRSDEHVHEQLAILLEVSRLLATPMEEGTLLEHVLDLAFQILDIDRAALLLVDERGLLDVRTVRTRTPLQPGEAVFSRNVVEYVRRHGVAALFSDAQADARLNAAMSIMRHRICSAIGAPLKPKGTVTGVLYVDNRSIPDRFAKHDVDFVSAFANQVAVAIDNTMLRRRLEAEAVTRSTMMRFFPPTTARRLLEGQGPLASTIDADVTALFADISGFTELSSTMAPRAVVELLNDYFPRVADAVFRHEGTLEKYIGDALLAVWGAPFACPDVADRALDAAVEMQRAVYEMNQRPLAVPIAIHIGLNSGTVAAGNIGSPHYLQYATIGDATNVASRVCNVAAPGEIVLSEATRQRLVRPRWPLEPLGAVALKGKHEPVVMYRVRWYG